jgi:D-lactate dehydrogenase (cytochrome)
MSNNVITAHKLEKVQIEGIRSVKSQEIISCSYPRYLIDESKLSGGNAEWLFFPKNENEVATIVTEMREENMPITISGARTGIVGSAVPFGGAVISLERMNKMIGLGYDEDADKWFVRLQPGLPLNEMNDIVKQKKFKDSQSIPQEREWIRGFQKERTYHYPVDPTEMTASVGGTIATNASGACSFKYGPTRKWVRYLRIVISSGEVLDIPRGEYKAKDGIFIIKTAGQEIEVKLPTYQMPQTKNAAGLYVKPDMDMIDLFIGSEGIFGVITEAELWLKEDTPQISNVVFFSKETDSIEFVKRLRANTIVKPEYIEFFDQNALALLRNKQAVDPQFVNMPFIPKETIIAISFGLAYSEETLEKNFSAVAEMLEECNSSLNNSWSGYEERELYRFKHFRHAVPEIVNSIIAERKKEFPTIHKLGTDMSVMSEHLETIMAFYHQTLQKENLAYVMWGHIGDNHIHVNILPRDLEELEIGERIYKKFAIEAVSCGGSVSAEHGVGKMKREYLQIMFGEEDIKQMWCVKKSLDPHFLFNRGNIFQKEER